MKSRNISTGITTHTLYTLAHLGVPVCHGVLLGQYPLPSPEL